MSSEKLTRQEIRSPDAFMRFTSQIWGKAVESRKAIALGLAGLLVVAIASGLVTRSREKAQLRSGAALAQALEISRQPVEGATDPSQEASGKKFKTAAEKDEALAKALAEVQAQYGGSSAAHTATLLLADIELRLGKLDDAAKHYEDYLSVSKNVEMRALAIEGLGYVSEARKNWEKAIENFDRMGKEAGDESAKARAAYQKARILALSGKKQEAANAFAKIKDEFKKAPSVTMNADQRLGLLGMEGVVAEVKPAPASSNEAAAPKK